MLSVIWSEHVTDHLCKQWVLADNLQNCLSKHGAQSNQSRMDFTPNQIRTD